MNNKGTRKKLNRIIEELENVAAYMPCVIVIHNIRELTPVYMSAKGLEELGISLEELQQLGPEYHNRFFNPEDIEDYLPRLQNMLLKNDFEEQISFFQQVRFKETAPAWTWHMSSVKLLLKGEDGEPLYTISISIPIDRMKHIEAKAEKLMQENMFLRAHYKQFSSLTNREKDILQDVASGLSSAEIASKRSIALSTVETHRKNVRKKLQVNTHFEMAQYARAFDLI